MSDVLKDQPHPANAEGKARFPFLDFPPFDALREHKARLAKFESEEAYRKALEEASKRQAEIEAPNEGVETPTEE